MRITHAVLGICAIAALAAITILAIVYGYSSEVVLAGIASTAGLGTYQATKINKTPENPTPTSTASK